MIHTYNGVLKSAMGKKGNNATCRNIDGPRDYDTKWRKSDRERQISHDVTHMWNLIFKWQK